MNQIRWHYVGPHGNTHKVTMFHGDTSGHVVIMVDNKITNIDFLVKKSKTYTFFIVHELVHLKIFKEPDGRYTYGFEIDHKADTPLNRVKKKIERKNRTLSVLSLLVFMGLFSGFIYAGYTFVNSSINKELLNHGKTTHAKVIIRTNGPLYELTYKFKLGDQIVYGKPTYHKTLPIYSDNGFILENGDEFAVLYAEENPGNNKLLPQSPSPEQLGIYKQRITNKYPFDKDINVKCLLDEIYHWRSLEGLALLYHYNTPVEENSTYNKQELAQLIDHDLFKSYSKKCASSIQ